MSDDSSIERKGDIPLGLDSSVEASLQSSSNWKVLGENAASDAIGVLGHATAGSGVTRGVKGIADSSTEGAAGVRGDATSDSGITYGVDGRSKGNPDGIGTIGLASTDSFSFNPTVGFPSGLRGETDWSDADAGVSTAYGVLGNTKASTGTSIAVEGNNFNSNSGIGVRGRDITGNAHGVVSVGDSKTTGNHEVTGHVQADDGFRGNVGATVHLGSDQSISNTDTVAYDSIEQDDRGEFDTTTNEFVCAYDGDYHVHATAEPGTVPEGDRVMLEIFTDTGGREAQTRRFGPPGGAQISVAVSKTLKGLSSGDKIHIVFKNRTNASSLTLDGISDSTYLSITQVG